MLLRLVACLGMVGFCIWQGIQASMPTAMVRILYSACAILLLSGLNPRGLITWPIASLLLLSRGHWIVGWIPVALVVFNVIGNRIKGGIKLGDSSMSNCSDMVLRSSLAVNTKCLEQLGSEDEKSRKTGLIASTMFVALCLKILEEYNLPYLQKDVMQTMDAYYGSIIPAKLSQDKSKHVKALLDMTLSFQKGMPSMGESALPGFMLGALGGTSSPLLETVDDIMQHAQEINVKAASLSSDRENLRIFLLER